MKAISEHHQNINTVDKKDRGRSKDVVKEKWKAPEDGWIKINCNGAFKPSNKIAGTRIVVRNSEGLLIEGKSRKCFAFCVVHVDALVVKDTISLAIEKKFQKVCLEMYSREKHLILSNKCQNIV